MRAHKYRPIFDSLDSRLLLSDTSGGLAPSVVIVDVAASNPSTLGVNPPPSGTLTNSWLLPGDPPDDPYDPFTPTQGGCD